MFAEAYTKASEFTRPLIVSTRQFDGSVKCSLGAFVVLNADGWIISAAHVLEGLSSFQRDAERIAEHKKRVLAIEENEGLRPTKKKTKISRLASDPKWVTNWSPWWGGNEIQLREMKILPDVDLVVGRLEPFKAGNISKYPTLKDPRNLPSGTSLCKLGYPFYRIEATYEENKGFALPPGTFPIPRFPIEGIYTRYIMMGKSKDGKYQIKFLETSSPGLKGQSGGPVFDVKGTVWGIQSKTVSLPLGFSPKVRKGNREVEENQFLNVGWAVHPEVLVAFLRDGGVQFELSDY